MTTKPTQSLNVQLPPALAKQFGPAGAQFFSSLQLVAAANAQSGATSQRPTSGLYVGQVFLDTTLNQQVVWNGTKWVQPGESGSFTPFGFLYGNAEGGISSTGAATDGQLLIGNSGGAPVAATLTAGKGIVIDDGAGSITIGIDPGYSISVATSLSGGQAGSVPYQTAPSATTFLPIGAPTYVMAVNANGKAPSWIAQSTMDVGHATNLDGGVQGSVPYQSSTGTTAMLAPGTAGQVLSTQGPGNNPTWINIPSVSSFSGDLNCGSCEGIVGAVISMGSCVGVAHVWINQGHCE